MSESQEKKTESPEEKPPVTYASPVKRVWAWVGVVYVVLATLLFTWYIAKTQFLQGIGSIMILPALGGVAAHIIIKYRSGTARGGLPVCIFFVAVCAVLAVFNLVVGIPALLRGLGV